MYTLSRTEQGRRVFIQRASTQSRNPVRNFIQKTYNEINILSVLTVVVTTWAIVSNI